MICDIYSVEYHPRELCCLGGGEKRLSTVGGPAVKRVAVAEEGAYDCIYQCI